MIGALLAAIVGLLIGIPVLRLQGDYLAIVTLAFGEIIKNILNCLYIGVDAKGLHFSMTDPTIGMGGQGTIILNGPMGAVGIQKLSTFVSGIILVLIVLFIIQNLVNSRSGRAIKAIRDNRIAAEACGLNITKYKLMAFVTSAAMAGAAGALYALNYSSIVPKKFDFNTSILILVFVVPRWHRQSAGLHYRRRGAHRAARAAAAVPGLPDADLRHRADSGHAHHQQSPGPGAAPSDWCQVPG